VIGYGEPGPAAPGGPRLPGARTDTGAHLMACSFEVRLEGFGIHTRRHYAGRLETHTFFSRAAVHAALWDLWAPWANAEYVADSIPYGSTPLWADSPRLVEIHYASPRGWQKRHGGNSHHLSTGTMEAMAPGTRLRGVVWGRPEDLPPIEEGFGFTIGKGRAPARIVRAAIEEVTLRTASLPDTSVPVQVDREVLRGAASRGLAHRRIADARRYLVIRVARGVEVAHFRLDGLVVPVLYDVPETTPSPFRLPS
jgi:hypothetical protein